MRLPSTLTLAMIDHLEISYFNRVWNATKDHGQDNFALTKAAKTVQIGAVPVSLSVVGLPTTDQVYAVYRAPINLFGKYLVLTPGQWLNVHDLLTSQQIQLTLYASTGRMLPGQATYVRYDQRRGIVLIAISNVYTKACTDQSYPDLYMTVYKDTSRQTPIVTSLYQTGDPNTVLAAITTAKATYPAGTIVYVNGWMYDPANVPALTTSSVVEIVSDPDIIGYCDLTIDDNQTGYYSNKFGEYREVLHLPKILNPNNYLITHDTLTIGLFDPVSNKGLYGHRLDPHAIEAVSHNDFSMSRSVLQAFQNNLGALSLRARLYVRYSTKPLVLGEDVNHLSDLYTLSDDEIKKQLVGLSLHPITEWNASNLEQSSYLTLVYTFPDLSSDQLIQGYSNAFGYYDVASTLSQAMHYYTYKGNSNFIRKPRHLVGYPCQLLVYANGLKVPATKIQTIDYTNSIGLSFTPDSYIAPSSQIGVYVTEGGLRTPISFNPTSTNPSMVLDSEDYSLVKIISYNTAQPVWQGSVTTGYQTLAVSPGDYHMVINNDNTVTLTVNPIHYNDHFYLVPYGGMDSELYQLDPILAAQTALILPLRVSDSNNNILPLIAYQTLEVYLNGYRLIEGLDYTCNPVMGSSNDVLQTLLVISNLDYVNLEGTGNVLETVVHGDRIASVDKGYAISNMMHRQEPPMIWSASCGRAYAHGLLLNGVTEAGEIVTSSQPIADGSPYLLEWSLPFSIAKLMQNVVVASDIDLRSRIFNVLHLVPPTYPSTVVLDHVYALYSPYLTAIAADVAAGIYQIINEPKDDQFLKQFVNYALLYTRDAVLTGNNNLIDRRFVTLAADYANFTISDPHQMLLMQRLISLTLNPSPLQIEQVLI